MYDSIQYWRYAVVAFFGLSILFPDKMDYLYRMGIKMKPYLYSLVPVASLVYVLYMVHTRL